MAKTPFEHFLDWEFMDAMIQVFAEPVGVGVVMLMVLGTTFLVLYQASDSVMVPVAVVIVLAPLIVGLLPAVGIRFLVVVLVLAIAALATWAFTRL